MFDTVENIKYGLNVTNTMTERRTHTTPNIVVGRISRFINPSQNLSPLVAPVLKTLQRRADKSGVDVTFFLGGSVAKGTNLAGDADIDIFARFSSKKHGTDNLSELLSNLMPKDAKRVHGSRDYFQFRRKIAGQSVLFEVVPVLRIRNYKKAQNVTDVSPLHVNYILKRLKKRPQLAKEILLTKLFCKAIKCYGAESYINGFSGHVLDLLIIHYGSFLDLLKGSTKWKAPVIIDSKGKKMSETELMLAIDKAKRQGPLIIIDPVQPNRNAAAALSKEKYERFITASRAFLANPSESFFKLSPLTRGKVVERYKRVKGDYGEKTNLLIMSTTALEGKDDVVATKLLMIHRHLIKEAKLHGIELFEEGWEYNKKTRRAIHFFITSDRPLPYLREQEGPHIASKNDSISFKKKHSKTYIRKGRLYAKIKRKYRTFKELLEGELSKPRLKERAKRRSYSIY